MKNKVFKNSHEIQSKLKHSSTIINIENSEALDIFGVNNENIDFFEKNLPLKIFQKGNQLTLKGDKNNINILKNAITKTINQKKKSEE